MTLISRLDALESAAKAAIPCPGAWKWEANAKSKTVTLGRRSWEAMGFARWGMSGAQPVFPKREDDGVTILRSASELLAPIPNREHHRDWAQVIDNPNAELIVSAVNLAPSLSAIARAAMARPWWSEDCDVDTGAVSFFCENCGLSRDEDDEVAIHSVHDQACIYRALDAAIDAAEGTA